MNRFDTNPTRRFSPPLTANSTTAVAQPGQRGLTPNDILSFPGKAADRLLGAAARPGTNLRTAPNFSDVVQETAAKTRVGSIPYGPQALGFGVIAATDPLNYTGGGEAKAGAKALTKAGKRLGVLRGLDDLATKAFSKPKKPTIPKPLQPLAQEARKCKSAEEFVGARGDGVIPITRFGESAKFSEDAGKVTQKADILNPQITDEAGVQRWVKKIKAGERPFVEVETTGRGVQITDGSHRLEAYRRLGIKEIPVKTDGSIPDNFFSTTKSQLTDFYNQATGGVPKKIAVERYQKEMGLSSRGEDTFFAPKGSGYTDYGDVKLDAFLDENARLYEGPSSFDFASERGLLNTPRSEVKKLTGGKMKTLQELDDDFSNGWEVTDDPNDFYAAFQDVARNELKKEGYDGAHWLSEDELSPNQFQIWNRDVIKTNDASAIQRPVSTERTVKKRQNRFDLQP